MNQQEILRKIDTIEKRVLKQVNDYFPLELPASGNVPARTVTVEDLKAERPALFNLNNELKLKDEGGSLTGVVKGIIVVKDSNTGKVLYRSNPRSIVTIPYLTNRGTYIIGGKEKVIAKQMRLKPGVYTYGKGDKVVSLMFLQRGKNLSLEFDPENFNLTLEIDKTTKNAIVFFRILGITDAEIEAAINDPKISQPLFRKAKSKNFDTEVSKLWHLLPCRYFEDNPDQKYPGKAKAIQDIQKYFFSISEFGETGSKVMNITLGHSSNTPDKQVFLSTLSKIIQLAKTESQEERSMMSDDRDDIRFQNVLADEDQIEFYVSKGLEDMRRHILSKGKTERNVGKLYNYNKVSGPLMEFMSKKSLVDMVDQTNPLHMSAAVRKVTSLGEGGLTARAASQETRNIQNSAFGKLDPVETPESGKIGLITHLSHSAEVEDLTIKSKYYKVTNGRFRQIKSNEVKLEPLEEHDKKIAFFDINKFQFSGNTVTLPATVTVRYRGSIVDVPRSEVDYVDIAPHVIWGDAAALIPFSAHNDGNRMLMGANMQKQALPLVNREAPLVQTAVDAGRKETFENKVANEYAFTVKSDVSGTVSKVSRDKIVVKDNRGKEKSYELMSYFPLNMNNYINNTPVVKPGDKVKKGQLLAEGWQTKEGTLALGTNVRIAYMPWKGYNFEDGYVISESLAKRMGTEELKEIVAEISPDQIGGPGSGVKNYLQRLNVPMDALSKLDDNGIIKPGEKVSAGTILVGIVEEEKGIEETPEYKALKAIGVAPLKQYKNISKSITGYTHGEVIRVKSIPRGEGSYTVKVTILVHNPLKEGDKLAGRHGNKGIITKIEADEDMPIAEDGKPIELIYSPLGVPSRKNLGQLYEVNAGLIAEKTGKPFVVYNFDKSEADRVRKGLEDIGFPDGKMILTDPKTGKPYENKVTVGNAYIMKLKHKVDEKLSARNIGRINRIYNSPVKTTGELAGEKENPQKWGEMEMRALQASKAVNLIDEAIKLKADAAGDQRNRWKIFDALGFGGLDQFTNGVPESLKVFKDYSTALGLNVKPLHNGRELQTLDSRFNTLAIMPLSDKEILRMSRGEVKTPGMYKSYVSGDKPEEKGLFDPKIFGTTPEEQRTYWGHIHLASPMPNPLLLNADVNPYTELTGINKSRIKDILNGKYAVILDPGDTGLGKHELVTMEQLDELIKEEKNFKHAVGGNAIKAILDKVNVKEELRKTEAALSDASPKDRPKLYRKVRILRMLDENNLKADELMVNNLPVLPAGIRPFSRKSGGRQVIDDMNKLYKDFMQINHEIKDINDPEKWHIKSSSLKQNLMKNYYSQLENVFGLNTAPVRDQTGTEIQGVLKKMKGKEGLIRERLLSKYLDYSGRSVITVNPSLEMDEAGLPVDIALKLYQPFVVKELVGRRGMDKSEAIDVSSNPDNPATWEALQKVVEDRPMILNRAPSLHRYSIQAFKPKLTRSRAIELNPLVVTGFNADFDGDQMGVHIPLTEDGIRDAKNLLAPSSSLINPTNGNLITPITGEAILGLYYLTISRSSGKPAVSYSSYDELYRDYADSNISPYDKVTLGGITATVGQHLVNHQLPQQYRDYKRVLTKKVVSELIEDIIKDDDNKQKGGGTQAAVVALNKLKDIGFLAATKSGMSIGIGDLVTDENKPGILRDADEMVRKDPSKIVPVYLDVQGTIEKRVNETLGKENPLSMFMTSGAKGKADQAARMSTMVGLSRDITGAVVPVPVKSSHKEGLSPQEFWVHTFDSRRGLADRALSTAEPGALTRALWNSTQDAIISVEDCGDQEGIYIRINDKSILGRYLARPVRDGNAVVYKRNTLVDTKVRDGVMKIKGVEGVYVRSPLTCKVVKGVCQKCYGNMPGTNDLPMIGEPVGILASQAIGEPTAQGTMKTFHGGGVAKDKVDVSQGIKRVKEIFGASDNPKSKSVLSPVDGKVVDVKKDVVNKIIVLEYVENGRTRTKNIRLPLTKEVLVKAGDPVHRGQRLTEEFGALAPREIMQYQGLPQAQTYMVNELAKAIGGDKVDRRHLELAVGKLTDKVEVGESSTSPWLPGQIILRNQADRWNADNAGKKQLVDINDTIKILGAKAGKTYKGFSGEVIVREGEVINQETLGKLMGLRIRKVDVYPGRIQYTPAIYGVTNNPLKGNENWFSQLGFEDIKQPLAQGAAFGQEDLLDEPRSRTMAGKLINVGEGFQKWKNEFENVKKRIGSSIANLFD